MSHETYEPAPQPPGTEDYTFDPAALHREKAALAAAPVAPPPPLSARQRRLGWLTLAALALGLVLFVLGEQSAATANATHHWIETTGVVNTTALRASPDGKGGTAYQLDLAYRYQAGVRPHLGHRIALHPELSREAAYAYAARYRPGATVPVWFDPAAPSSAVLEHASSGLAPVLLALAALLLLFGLAGLVIVVPPAFRLLRHWRQQ